MTDPKRVTEAWRELRPQLGEFLNRLDNCMAECVGEAEAYKKGFNEGSKKTPLCDICPKVEWWAKTACDARLREAIEKILKLQPDSQMLIYALIDKIYSIKSIKLEEMWK